LIIMIFEALVFGIFSFLTAYFLMGILIPIMKSLKMVGTDINKPNKPKVAEIGGLAIISPVILFLFIWGYTAIAISITIIAFIGLIDDVFGIPQMKKAIAPMIAGIPLLFVVNSLLIDIPFIGFVNFGVIYIAILFLSLAVSSNLTNMLAGFNGMEWGMAVPMFLGSLMIGVILNIPIVILMSALMLGACFAGFLFGFPIAKAFPGDVGTLSIGGIMAIMLMVGHIEAYAIVFVPYLIDFFLKLKSGMPSSGWWGKYKNGMLHCEGSPKGFAQWIMKYCDGISEIRLVMFFMAFETLFVGIGYFLVMV